MPNIKIHIDETLCALHRPALIAALGPIRDSIIRHLGVPLETCQMAIIPVLGLPDQCPINAEIQIMPGAARTRSSIEDMGHEIQRHLFAATGASSAFRCLQHDPSSYVILR